MSLAHQGAIVKWIAGLLLLVVLLCSGCKTANVSIKGDKSNTVGTLIAWDPSWSAGMVLPADDKSPDRMCLQNALGMKALSGSGDAQADANVISALAKTASTLAGQGGPGVKASGEFAQAITVLTTSTERTTFLNVGMFYLCQLGANGSISPTEAKVLVSELITAASKLEPKAAK